MPVALNRRQLLGASPFLMATTQPAQIMTGRYDKVLRFIVLGDWGRRGHHFQPHVAKGMQLVSERTGVHFIATTGDNFYTFGVSDKSSSHWRDSYRDVYGNLVEKPWFACLGNHDYSGNPTAQLGGLDGTGWHMPGSNYVIEGSRFGHSEVDLFFLDTVMWNGGNSFPQNLASVRVPGKSTERVKSWFVTALAQSRAKIKIVFGHHPVYSVGPHGGVKKMVDLDTIMKAASVTAYVNGHDHCLYHIRDPKLDYICSGGGSEELRRYTGGPHSGCINSADCVGDVKYGPLRWERYIDRAGFAVFEISAESAQFAFIDRDLTEVYRRKLPLSRPNSFEALRQPYERENAREA